MSSTILTPPAAVLAVGALLLDGSVRRATGPAGSVSVPVGVYPLLKELMRHPGETVAMSSLIAAAWPDPDLEPPDAAQCIRKRIYRVRDVLTAVGVPRNRLVVTFSDGYLLKGEPRVVRSYSLAEAARIDALLAANIEPHRGSEAA